MLQAAATHGSSIKSFWQFVKCHLSEIGATALSCGVTSSSFTVAQLMYQLGNCLSACLVYRILIINSPGEFFFSTPAFEGELFRRGVIFSMSSFHFWQNEILIIPLQTKPSKIKERDLQCMRWDTRGVKQGKDFRCRCQEGGGGG